MGVSRHTDFRTGRVLQPTVQKAANGPETVLPDSDFAAADHRTAPTVLLSRAPRTVRAVPPPLPPPRVTTHAPPPPKASPKTAPPPRRVALTAHEARLGQRAAEDALARVDLAPGTAPLHKPNWIGAKHREERTGLAQKLGSWILAVAVVVAILAGVAVALVGSPAKLQALIANPPAWNLLAPKQPRDRNARLPQASPGGAIIQYRPHPREQITTPALAAPVRQTAH